MSKDIAATVRKLVELAASNANVEEARNAALKACRLIKLHGLEVHVAIVQAADHGVAAAQASVTESVRNAVRSHEAKTGRPVQETIADAAAHAVSQGVSAGIRDLIGGFGRARRRR